MKKEKKEKKEKKKKKKNVIIVDNVTIKITIKYLKLKRYNIIF